MLRARERIYVFFQRRAELSPAIVIECLRARDAIADRFTDSLLCSDDAAPARVLQGLEGLTLELLRLSKWLVSGFLFRNY